MFVCCLLCVVRYRSLRRADHSSRGVLPTAARRCVLSRNLADEENIVRVGLQSKRKNNNNIETRIAQSVQWLIEKFDNRRGVFRFSADRRDSSLLQSIQNYSEANHGIETQFGERMAVFLFASYRTTVDEHSPGS
jgi:hypothetical protein